MYSLTKRLESTEISKLRSAEDWRIFWKWIMELFHRFKPRTLAVATLILM